MAEIRRCPCYKSLYELDEKCGEPVKPGEIYCKYHNKGRCNTQLIKLPKIAPIYQKPKALKKPQKASDVSQISTPIKEHQKPQRLSQMSEQSIYDTVYAILMKLLKNRQSYEDRHTDYDIHSQKLSFDKYFKRLNQYMITESNLDPVLSVYALSLILRLTLNTTLLLDKYNVSLLYAISLLIIHKYFVSKQNTDTYQARIIGINIDRMNKLANDMLTRLNHQINTECDELVVNNLIEDGHVREQFQVLTDDVIERLFVSVIICRRKQQLVQLRRQQQHRQIHQRHEKQLQELCQQKQHQQLHEKQLQQQLQQKQHQQLHEKQLQQQRQQKQHQQLHEKQLQQLRQQKQHQQLHEKQLQQLRQQKQLQQLRQRPII